MEVRPFVGEERRWLESPRCEGREDWMARRGEDGGGGERRRRCEEEEVRVRGDERRRP